MNKLKLSREQWEIICGKLILYVVVRAKFYGWHIDEKGVLPNGESPEDIAFSAIKKVLEGKRRWNETKHPDLLFYLKSVVNSDLSHLYQSWDNNRVCSYSIEWFDKYPSKIKDPEKIFLQEQNEKTQNEILEFIKLSLGDDPIIKDMFQLKLMGFDKPREMAEKLNINIDVIYKKGVKLRKKILDLSFDKVFQKMLNEDFQSAI